MNKGLNVYTTVKQYRIQSMHSETTNYLVCYGYVDWDRNGDLRPAIYTLMEYKDFIKYDNPPHILTVLGEDGRSDLDKVLEKINLLREEFDL